MIIKKTWLYFLFFVNVSVQAEQFLYPVAHFDDSNQLVVIYQKSLQDIELWFLDQKNDIAIKGLSSFFIPANFRMLPSGDGFSFIDGGYIKIKQFQKRSPKTLGIYEPIGSFSSMNWIDDHTFYFTAQEGDFYQVFCCDDESNIKRLSCLPIDFLYPQKIGDQLYCIQRDLEGQFKIISQLWQPVDFASHQILPESIILPETNRPLCFLHMLSDVQGFYLQAPEFKQLSDNDSYEFACYHLVKIDDQWMSEQLFVFNVPLKYIHGSTRLYESIEPFLPNYSVENYVYYSTYNKDTNLFELLSIDISSKTTKNYNDDCMKKNGANNSQLFAPHIFNSKIYCGKIFQDTRVMDFTQKDLMDEITIFDTK